MREWREMSQEQIHEHVAYMGVLSDLADTACKISMQERETPGLVAALLSMPQSLRSGWLLDCRHGAWLHSPDILIHADGVRIVDGNSGAYVKIDQLSTTPVPLSPTGHCPSTSACANCRWDMMTPAERLKLDQPSDRSGRRVPGRSATPAPVQEIADWERELLAQQA